MAIETIYSRLRDNLATVLDKVGDDHEVVIVRRRGSPDVALVPADELRGLMETAHLLRSPRNARRLLTALGRVGRLKSKASTLDQLRRESLKFELAGAWSRRITQEHRLVYKVTGKRVDFLQARYHY